MDFSESITLALVTLFMYLFWITRKITCKNRLPPEAPGGWPLVGHLPLLATSEPGHLTLGNMADKTGPIFTIRLGLHRAIVVSNWEMAKECLTINDKAFANRPKAAAFEIMGYNNIMLGTGPYGNFWREIRKIVTLHILSSKRVEMVKHVRETEVEEAIRVLHQKWSENKISSSKASVEMKSWFEDITMNVILKMIVGKRYVEYSGNDENSEESEEWKKALRDLFILTGTFVVSDALPFLKWLDLGGHLKAMKRTAKRLDHVMEGWLQQHKKKRVSGVSKSEEDFMDVLMSKLEDSKELANLDLGTVNKATCLSLILAATDTSSVPLTWTLSLLLNNPDVLRKAQNELDFHVGRERKLMESDTKNLVYLDAIVKESLRLYPSVPLLVPHESMEDCTIGGYNIPAGTRLFINASKIHRDSTVWPDASEFRPERFLTTHKDVGLIGQNFELIPFGSGRRMCPGIHLALQIMKLTLASLLHSFDVETPSGQQVDMSESLGITNVKATPLDVLISPRLSAHLY